MERTQRRFNAIVDSADIFFSNRLINISTTEKIISDGFLGWVDETSKQWYSVIG